MNQPLLFLLMTKIDYHVLRQASILCKPRYYDPFLYMLGLRTIGKRGTIDKLNSLIRIVRGQIAEQLSQAIEIKMGELMGEIELGLRSPVKAHPAANPPRDTRVDASLDELKVRALDS